MSFGEIDTMNLLFEKLSSLFDETQGYYESFFDINKMYKEGRISDKEFFEKMGDYVVAYSALEFLAVKALFEIKKSLGTGSGNTQSPGLMPGMGNPAMMAGAGMPGAGMGGIPRSGTPQNPVGGPPGIVSAKEAFDAVGTLPSPDPTLMPGSQHPAPTAVKCASCRANLRPNAKFCTRCGAKA